MDLFTFQLDTRKLFRFGQTLMQKICSCNLQQHQTIKIKFPFLVGMCLLMSVKVMAWPGEVLRSFDAPGTISTGITWDGEYLWVSDRASQTLYALDPENGEVQKTLDAPAWWPQGMTWDGEALWSVDIKGGLPLSENYKGVAYRIDPQNNRVKRTVKLSVKKATGLAWDGEYLWVADNANNEITRINAYDGTTITSFKAPTKHSNGLTFDGKYLYVADRYRDEIYMVSPENGSVIQILHAPGKYTRGLAFDGEYLWAVDSESDKIYKIVARDNDEFKRFNPRKVKVTHTHKATNFGPGLLTSLDIHLAVPRDRNSQEIHGEVEFSEEMPEMVNDQWDQQTAHYHREDIKPGAAFTASMTAEATLYQVRYYIDPAEVGTLEDIPEEIQKKYLRNNEKYQYEHPVIQDAVLESVGDENNPYWIARKLYNHLIDNMYYKMEGGWNTAPAVLERGNGSCSEYAFAYIAMCRAVGIPARYVGSVVVRGDRSSMDDVYHRWAEIYMPGYGWIPVDPSGGDKDSPRGQADAFGALDNRFLITTQSGGNSETMEWTYNSNEFYEKEPKTFVVTDHFADWKLIEEN
ncbi:MAG: transglutaminase domain-containing protein [Bacteroidales bacterium]